jgi:eukaryotic-like serine/threonine-protein kinase
VLEASNTSIPLWAALRAGAHERERQLAKWGQGVSLLSLFVSMGFAAAVDMQMGATMAFLGLCLFVYFGVTGELLDRGVGAHVLRWFTPMVEISVPLVAITVLMEIRGPRYTMGSWVPPMLYCIFIAASVFRLQPWLPMLIGAIAALQWSLVCWFWILPELGSDLDVLHRPAVQMVRTSSLLVVGGACSLTIVAMRRTISEASRAVRAQELFGKYRYVREIASGGMGKVIEALYCPEGGFSRRVAIKLIHPHLAESPELARRFRSEAAIASRLVHPNIVQPLDFGEVDDRMFFAMEYVDGYTLSQVMTHCRLHEINVAPEVVVAVGAQVADALQFANKLARDAEGRRMQVVHRDLSPSNILVDRVGVVKISDFGVARAMYTARHLHTENLVGKPSYMPPELLSDGPIDGRSDLWSLAVVLWEMTTQQRLFFRETAEASMQAVLDAPVPSINEFRPHLSPAWDEFFAVALARDASVRFQTARDLSKALMALAEPADQEALAELLMELDEVPELDLDPPTAEVDKAAN